MMRNRSWLAGLASKIFPRRFAAARRASRRRPTHSLRNFSDAPLASEALEPRHLLTASSSLLVNATDILESASVETDSDLQADSDPGSGSVIASSLQTTSSEADNQPPVNSVPDSQSTTMDMPLAFTAYGGNAISISDPDAGNLEVEVTLTANEGVVTLVNRNLVSTGLSYSVGDGLEDSVVTFQGKIFEINTALSWVAFTPDDSFTGTAALGTAASLQIKTDDLGNVGFGGSQSDTDSISIDVEPPSNPFDPSPTWSTFPGRLDDSFDTDGRKTLSLTGGLSGSSYTIDGISQLVRLDDGKFVAAGAVDGQLAVMRFTSDLQIDGSFGVGGVASTYDTIFSGGWSYDNVFPSMLAVDEEGRLLVGSDSRLYRFLANGTMDSSFGESGDSFYIDGGYITTYYTQLSSLNYVRDISLQGDGQILIAGSLSESSSYNSGRIYRMDADGKGATELIYSSSDAFVGVRAWGDGDILAVTDDFKVLRYSRDAVHEQTYATGLGTAYSALKLPDNRMLVVGRSTLGNLVVSRHLDTGELDDTFGNSGSTQVEVLDPTGTDTGYRATLQADGKILIAGTTDTGADTDVMVARLSYDGVPDTTFTVYGEDAVSLRFGDGTDDVGHAIAVLPDGKIVVAGSAGSQIGLARLLGDSDQSGAANNQAPVNSVPTTASTTMDVPLAFTAYGGNAISISDPDAGNLEVEVTLTANEGVVTLVNRNLVSTGLSYSVGDGLEDSVVTFQGKIFEINTALSWVAFTPDDSFTGTAALGTAASLQIKTDDLGNVGFGGSQSDTDSISIDVEPPSNPFDPSPTWSTFPGRLDDSFDTDGRKTLSLTGGLSGSSYTIDGISQLVRLDDGKFVAAGAVDGQLAVMRFTSDLQIDGSFGVGGVASTYDTIFSGGWSYDNVFPSMLAVDEEGRLLVGSDSRLYRFLANGTMDSSFGESGDSFYIDGGYITTYYTQLSSLNYVRDISLQGDGQILIAGSLSESSSYNSGRIYRMDADGKGATELIYSSSDAFVGVRAWGDGDILAVTDDFKVLRYSRDAVHEQTYATGLGTAYSALKLPDNRMLVVGRSTLGNLVVSRHLDTGELDDTFGNSGSTQVEVLDPTGTDTGYRATLQADGKILIAGTTDTGADTDVMVARLSYDGVPDTTFTVYGEDAVSLRFGDGTDDVGHAIAVLPDGKIVVAGSAGSQIGLARLLGDSDQSGAANNQAPVNSVPTTASTTMDVPLNFTISDQNMISISDPDAGNLEVEVTLTASDGVVTLVNRNLVSTGLSYSVGDGLEDSVVTFQGKIFEINTALSWVAFTPDDSFTGTAALGTAASLQIKTDDLGNVGFGGSQSDTDSISIDVEPPSNPFDPSPTWSTFPGRLDDSFDTDGRKTLSLTGGLSGSSYTIDGISQLVRLDDGKFVAAGAVDGQLAVMRFTSDLQIDGSFGVGGVASTYDTIFSGGWSYDNVFPSMLAVDEEGRLLVGSDSRLYRFLANGTMDSSFGESGDSFYIDGGYITTYYTQLSSLNYVRDISLQGDGQILIAGSLSESSSYNSGRIYRMDADGKGATELIYSSSDAFVGVRAWGDGDILAVTDDFKVLRYSRDAVHEQTYATGLGTAYSALKLPDNRMLVVGRSTLGNLVVSRHLDTGELDDTFGNSGSTQVEVLDPTGTDTGYRATLQADGKILIAGTTDTGADTDVMVARLSYDGVPDTTFTVYGEDAVSLRFGDGTDDVGHAIAVLPDGKIVVAGSAGSQIGLARLLGDSDQSGAANNQAPVNSVPTTASTTMDVPLAFTAYGGNAISISDPDAGNLEVEVTLTANEGVVTLVNRNLVSTGLSYSVGDGLEDSVVTFQGKIFEINTALSWVAFTPDDSFTGTAALGTAASLQIKTDDLGNVGFGGSQSDTDSISIDVEPPSNPFDPSPTWSTFPGRLDDSFDTDGRKTLSLTGGLSGSSYTIDGISQLVRLDDGKFVAAGAVDGQLAVMRFTSDLQIDGSFGVGGVASTYDTIFSGGWSYDNVFPSMLAVDEEGRLLVGSDSRLYRFLANGTMDSSFGESGDSFYIDGGYITTYYTQLSSLNYVRDISLQGDGQILIAGSLSESSSYNSGRIYRMDADGKGATELIYSSSDAFVGVRAWGDGDILAVTDDFKVLRYSRDAVHEQTYATGLGTAYSALKLPDNRMLVVGRSTLGNLVVSRHLDTGELDDTFGNSGSTQVEVLDPTGTDTGYRATLQADGKILIAGTTDTGADTDVMVARLSYDGVPDTTFTVYGEDAVSLRFGDGTDDVGHAIAVLPDGKIVVAGSAGSQIGLARLLGDSDQSGAANNQAPVNSVPTTASTTMDVPLAFTAYGGNAISISDPDAGNLEVEVTLTANEGVVTLVNRNLVSTGLSYSVGDGLEDSVVTFQGKIFEINTALSWVAFTPDDSFTGTAALGTAASLQIKTDDLGNVGFGGSQSDTDSISIDVEPPSNPFDPSPTWSTFPGRLDDSFDTDGRKTLSLTGGLSGSSYTIDGISQLVRLDDGKFVAAGAVDGQLAVMRFTSDLQIDGSFGVGGVASTYDTIFSGGWSYDNVFPSMLAVDEEGRLLVGSDSRLYRFLANGTMDSSFGESGDSFYIDGGYITTYYTQLSSLNYVRDISLQGDGQILIAGSLSESSSYNSGRIYRMDADGKGATELIYSSSDAFVGVRAWGDGDILAVTDDFKVLRYSRDAVHEQTYATGLGTAYSALKLPDNRMLVVGRSTLGNLVVSRHLDTGELDDTFGNSGSTQVEVLDPTGTDTGYRATLQADGKILIAGTTDTGADTDVMVARLSYDGVPDTTFTVYGEDAVSLRFGDGTDDVGHAIAVLPDGKIVVAGSAGSQIGLARLLGDSDQSGAANNQAPVNSVPTTASTTMDVPLAFTAYGGNAISISDPDAGNLEVEVTLTANEGVVTLVNRNLVSTGLSYSVGDGLEDSVVTFQGKIFEINTALSWVAFTPDDSFTGTAALGTAASLQIKTDDLGNVGFGGSQSDTDSISIDVEPPSNPFDPSPTWSTFPGRLDDSFDTDGRKTLSLTGGLSGSSYTIDGISQLVRLDDGKFVAAGAVDGQLAVMRFTSDLQIDGSFGVGGVASTYDTIFSGGWSYDNVFPSMLAVDEEGRLLVGSDSRLYRFLANGTMDSSFGESGDSFYIDGGYITTYYTQLSSLNYVRDISLQGDGQILIAGSLSESSSYNSGRIYRMDADGKGATELIYSSSDAFVGVRAWGDGDILAVTDDFKVLRYSRDAVHEQTYATGLGTAYSALKLPDNRMLVVGRSTLGNLVVSRHLDTGELDDTFGNSGSTQVEVLDPTGTDTGYRATLQADGKILIAGTTDTGADTDVMVARLSYDGVPDTTFTVYGEDAVSLRFGDGTDDVGHAIAVLPDGKIVVAGSAGSQIGLARLLGDSDYINDPPTIDPIDPQSMTEDDVPLPITLTGILPGGGEDQEMSVVATSSDPSILLAEVIGYVSPASSANLRLTPLADQHGQVTVTVTVTDGGLDGVLATTGDNGFIEEEFVVTIGSQPDAPQLADQPNLSLAENSATDQLVADIEGSDADDASGDSLTYSIVGDADFNDNGIAAFRIEGNQLLVNDPTDLNYEADQQLPITIEVRDTTDLSSTALFTVTLTDVNEAPQFTSTSTATIDENTTTVSTVSATDPDAGDTQLYSISGGADSGVFTIDPVSGVLSLRSPANYEIPASAAGTNTYVVEVSVTDAAELATGQSIAVTVQNIDEKPVLTLLGSNPLSVDMTSEGTYVDAGATALDPEDGDISADVVLSGDTVDLTTAGTYTVLYNVSDSSENAADEITRTVIVTNVLPPVITLNGDAEMTVEAASDGTFADPGATALDEGDGDVSDRITVGGEQVDLTVPGTYVILYDCTDLVGNAAEQVSRTVTVQDTLAPVITLSGSDAETVEAGFAYSDAGATASDSLDGDLTGNIQLTGGVDTATLGTYVLNYNVADSAGNDAETVTRTVTVEDTLPPVITLQGTSPFYVEAGTLFQDPGVIASDSFEGELTTSVVVGGDAVDANTLGDYTVRYDVQDGSSNSATQVLREVTVRDTLAPVITLLGESVMQLESGDVYQDPGFTASDSFEGDLAGSVVVSGDTVVASTPGTYTVLYNVSDSSENAAVQVARTVSVSDVNEIPVITLVGDSPYVLEASNAVSYSDPGATASDPEDGDISGSVQVSGQVVNLSVPGSYLINYDVQDSAGNDAETVTRTVVVQDTLAPVITLVGSEPTFVEAGFPYTDAGATASDSLDGDVSGSVVISGTVDTATLGTYMLTYNAQDAAGNAADPVTRTVTVEDTLRPVIAMSYGGEVLQVSDQSDSGMSGQANAPSGVPSETSLGAVGDAGRLATPITRATSYTQPDGTPVTSRQEWSARSPAGADPIVVGLPSGAVWDHGDSSIAVSESIVLLDRDGSAVNDTVDAVDLNVRSTYLFRYDAQDQSGNYAEQVVFALILDDQAAPTITVVGGNSETVEAASDWTLAAATSSDNIDGDLTANIIYSVENISNGATLGTDLTYAEAAAILDTMQVGQFVITMQVSDAAGIYGNNNANNTTYAQKGVLVRDTLAPVIALTGESVVNLTVDPSGTYSDAGATAVDSLDGDLTGSVVVGGDLVDLSQPGTYTLTYNVSDSAGNDAEQVTRTVNVVAIGSSTVSIASTQQGSEADNSATIFTLTRTGDTAGELTVNLLMLGSAKAGVDYIAPTGLGVDNTLAVSFADGEATTTIDLQTLSDAVVDPLESIQAILQPGTGYNIAPAKDRGTVYLGAEGVAVELNMLDSANSSSGVKADDGFTPGGSQATNIGAFTALNTDGTVSTWGEMVWGYAKTDPPAEDGFTQVVPNAYSFAGLKQDGTIECWGRSGRGGGGATAEISAPVDGGYVAIYSNEAAFAALKPDGSLTIWGHAGHGAGSSIDNNQGFVHVVANAQYFTAFRDDGTLWSSLAGYPTEGEFIAVTANKDAFTAMRADGSLVLWGEVTRGNGLPSEAGFERIYSNPYASAGLTADGAISSWGYDGYGGAGEAPVGTGYTTIVPSHYGFAALHLDGTVRGWGPSEIAAPTDDGYVQLVGNEDAFAALREDGTVETWGNAAYGGSGGPDDGGYVHLFSAGSAFVAMKADGSLTAWGNGNKGGSGAPTDSGYVQVYGNTHAFVAMKVDGSLTAWGDAAFGGSGAPAGTGFVDFATPKPQFLLGITNQAPSAVTLIDAVGPLSEDYVVSSPLKVADIQVTDDGHADSNNVISLSGTDALSFSVVGMELYLAAGTALDYETQGSYDVTVAVQDMAVAGSTPVTANYTLMIDDVVETIISGALYEDSNRNGTRDIGEAGISDLLVYIDLNQNARHDSDEPSLLSSADDPATLSVDESGTYSFENFLAGEVFVSAALPEDGAMWVRSQPNVPFFADAVGYDGLIGDRGVASGDLNNDGYADLVGIGSGLSVVLIDDGGVLSSANYATGSNSYGLDIADLDNDGDQDIVVFMKHFYEGGPAGAKVYLNDGSGGFANSTEYYSPTVFMTGFALADVENDGDLDIMLLDRNGDPAWDEHPGNDEIEILLNDGAGVFGAPTDHYVGFDQPSTLRTGDFNADGFVDALVGRFGIQLVLNNQDGTFTSQQAVDYPASYLWSMQAGDIDADGDIDIVATYHNVDVIYIYANDGAGSFSDAGQISAPTWGHLGVTLEDLNGDGHLDILANPGASSYFLENDGLGNFAELGTAPEVPSERYGFFDFNGDSLVDFATSTGIRTNLFGRHKLQVDAGANLSAINFGAYQLNEAPTEVALVVAESSLAEDVVSPQLIKLADIVITDDAFGTNAISLTGTDAASFEVDGTELFLSAGTSLDYEAKSSYAVTVSVEDSSVAGSTPVTVNYTLLIDDVNEAPTGVALTNVVVSLPEDTDTTSAVKVADIQVTDDALGTNVISLSGTDAASFTVVGTELYLAAGVALDYETKTSYDVTISVEDSSVSGSTPVTVNYTLAITDVNENPTTSVTILDDGEAGFAENGFTQQSNAQVAAAYDGDVHHMQGGTGEASWTFTGLPADRYQVAATWAFKYNNNYNATDAPFTLSDGAGSVFSTQIVNQKNAPAEFEDAGYYWDTLDTVEVSGGTLVVTLGAGSAANKYVVADAIRVSVAPTLTVEIADAAVAESAGAAATTATLTRNGSLDADLVVSLTSGDATEASVPSTVTILAGQLSTTFNIDAEDDAFFDGTQTVTFSATATGYSAGSDSLEILDDETSHTALIDDGDAGFAQSGFSYLNNVQVAAAYNGDNYSLRNGDDADQASWTFTGLDDGAYRVMATWAHKYNNNYNATDAPFQILDAGSNVLSSVAINQKNAPSQHDVGGTFWDTLDTVYVAGGELTVTVGATAQANKFVVADAVRIEQLVQPSSTLVVQLGEEIVDEDAGSVTGIVSRGAETVGDLIVTLGSDDTAVGTVPATVTIPDGAGAVPFTLTVVDDAVVDGDQQVAVTATAVGYTGGTDSLLVEDDEFPPVQIIDNGDAGFTETGGFKERTWAEAYDGDNHYMRGSDGEARWHFTDLIDGEYTVSVTWDHISDNRYNATDAPFTIRNAADEQLLAAAVDQTLSPADFSDGVTDWHTLGTVYVIDGELTVSLTEALVNKYVVADAVRIEIDTNPTSKLLVILDASSVSEAGTLNGKVIRTGEPAGSLTVNLASDNAAAATVPATITLGEGARYGTFAITPTDDSTPDGTQVANIAATAEGFTAGTAAVDVLDDDATILFVDNGEDGFVADAGFKRRNVVGAYQNDNHYMRGGTGEASWTFTGLEEGQYFVSTTWNHIWDNRYNTEKAPFSITNGSGNLLATTIVDQTQTPADFTDGGYGWEALAPVYINDGTLIVTLGASPTNHHAVADAIRIELNESLAPSLFVLVDSESESAGSATGTVVRTGDTSSEAVVGLTSSNPDAATVESSITFAIGESTKSFAVTPTDDSSPDGIQQSTIEATAASYAAGTAVLNVEDDDALEVAIMDNTDSGFTSNGFRYNANKQVSQAYGGNNESLKGGEPGEEASWTFTGLTDGVYHVSATWNHQYDNNYNATDAQYSITNAADEALATTTINQSNAPSEFLDNGIAWGTLDTVTVTGGELIVTVSGGSNQNRHTVADAVRIARVAELGGSSMQSAEADPFYDPLEDSLDDLASEWSGASEEEDRLVWGE